MTLPCPPRGGGWLDASDSVALSALDAIPGASVLVFDRELRCILCAGQALADHGISPQDLEGHPCAEVIAPNRWAIYEPMYRAALAGESRSAEVPDPDHARRYVIDVAPCRAADATISGGVAIARDVTAQRKVEGELQEAQRLFEQAFAEAPIGMALVGLDGQWMRVNRALCDITGYPAEELRGKTFADITHPDDVGTNVGEAERLAHGSGRDYHVEKRYINKQGDVIWVNVSVSVVRDADGRPSYFITQVLDVTRRKRLEHRLRNLADYDSLTGLPNRRYFEEALALQLGRCVRYDETAALLMLDLDDFKAVNDGYGHRAGDELLAAVAGEIRKRIRVSDVAGRLGGDEFAVLLLNPPRDNVDFLAAQVVDAVSRARIDVASVSVGTRASIGATYIDASCADPDSALALADKAMYAAKARHLAGVERLRMSWGVVPGGSGPPD
jgi:diguanylate cyclase (GGDEF)-like protein/PAS domain S-box-containing protein